jgi:hypothetical protein
VFQNIDKPHKGRRGKVKVKVKFRIGRLIQAISQESNSEDGGSTFLRNIGRLVPDYRVLHTRL